MAEDQKDRYIHYLAEQHREDELTKKAMQLVLEDFMAGQKELEAQMASLMSEQSAIKVALMEERKKRKSAECKAKSLQEKLDYANRERFGDRRQRVRKKTAAEGQGRPKRTARMRKTGLTERKIRSVQVLLTAIDETSMREYDLSNSPDEYKKMGNSQ